MLQGAGMLEQKAREERLSGGGGGAAKVIWHTWSARVWVREGVAEDKTGEFEQGLPSILELKFDSLASSD